MQITRALALFGSLLILVLIVFLAFSLNGGGENPSEVTLDEILAVTQPAKADDSSASLSGAADMEIPDSVRRNLDGENVEIVLAWVEDMNAADRADFFDNLDKVLKQAYWQKADADVARLFNTYHALKLEKMSQTEFELIGGEYKEMARKAAVLAAILGLAILFVLATMIIMLKSIETNTRASAEL